MALLVMAARPKIKPMRLTPEAIQTITQAAKARWGDGACVRLFGSRTDDAAKGGDIDLHISVPSKLDNPVWESAQFAAYLQRQLEGRKVRLDFKRRSVACCSKVAQPHGSRILGPHGYPAHGAHQGA